MSNEELPAVNWLGYGIDMSRATPMDILSATHAVQSLHRILKFNEDDTRPVTVDGVIYNVPLSIAVAKDVDGNSGSFLTYTNGIDAAAAFRDDFSLALRYFAVTGDISVSQATEKLFRRDNQYAFFSWSQDRYQARLKDYTELVNTTVLEAGISDLPTPFDGKNQDTLDKYKSFFQRYGTHVITKTRYGARLQLNTWGSNADPAVNARWAPDVRAQFGGIPSGGVFDEHIEEEAQWTKFSNFVQWLISAEGGSKTMASDIVINPTSYQLFLDWTKTADMRSSLLGMVTDEIWSLMKDSNSTKLRTAARTIQDSFQYIVLNPQMYKTAVSFSVESDWAAFGLLTPSAIIIPGSTIPAETVITETKVMFGQERSHKQKQQIIQFFILNDGYPIDFYIAHGTDGSVSGSGKGTITIGNKEYVNDTHIDNNWNNKYFYQVSVTGVPEAFVPKERPANVQPWEHVLEGYLEHIGLGHNHTDQDGAATPAPAIA